MMPKTRGFMLIEVLAALVLLGGTVVTLLVAQSKSLEQLRIAQRQATAAHLARELLTTWQVEEVDLVTGDEGVFDGNVEWSWRRTVERTTVSGSIPMTQVTVEIIYVADDAGPQIVAQYEWFEVPDDETRS